MKKKNNLYKKWSFIFATWFSLGKSSFMPGTVGSFAALPLCWLMIYIGGTVALLTMVLFIFVLGTVSTKEVLKHSKHDPSFVVIDEVVGQMLAFSLISSSMPNLGFFLCAFFVFRFFDITKIWPANYFDRQIKNSYGVMLDDVVAGIYSALVLYLIDFYL